MKHRYLAASCAVLLLFLLTACGSKAKTAASGDGMQGEEQPELLPQGRLTVRITLQIKTASSADMISGPRGSGMCCTTPSTARRTCR